MYIGLKHSVHARCPFVPNAELMCPFLGDRAFRPSKSSEHPFWEEEVVLFKGHPSGPTHGRIAQTRRAWYAVGPAPTWSAFATCFHGLALGRTHVFGACVATSPLSTSFVPCCSSLPTGSPTRRGAALRPRTPRWRAPCAKVASWMSSRRMRRGSVPSAKWWGAGEEAAGFSPKCGPRYGPRSGAL